MTCFWCEDISRLVLDGARRRVIAYHETRYMPMNICGCPLGHREAERTSLQPASHATVKANTAVTTSKYTSWCSLHCVRCTYARLWQAPILSRRLRSIIYLLKCCSMRSMLHHIYAHRERNGCALEVFQHVTLCYFRDVSVLITDSCGKPAGRARNKTSMLRHSGALSFSMS
jgi:hypothetical protein